MAGKIKNCPMCGKLFNDTGHKVCMDCFDKIQEKEQNSRCPLPGSDPAHAAPQTQASRAPYWR